MSKRRHFIHDEYHDGKVNHIFGIFEMVGNIASSAINKDAQDDANDINKDQFNEQMDYSKSRDEINDARYAEETSYNRAFAEDERAYNRAFAENERAYNRAFAEDERAYNRAFQEDNRAYTRALQQQIFEREDTALERQAQSLSSLGINPLSVNMQGLGAGQALTSPSPVSSSSASSSYGGSSAPSAGNAQHASLPSAPDIKAFTGWNFSGLEPSLEFMNELDNLHTAGIQRDLLRAQENYQKLVNMAFANDNDIKLDEYGNPIGITNTVTNQEIKKAEQEGRNQDNRSKKANANIDEREDSFQYNTGSHKSVTLPSQVAYDMTWAAQNAATGIKNAYNNHVDNANKKSDSKIAKLQDRLSDAGSKLLTHTINTFMNARGKIASWYRKHNDPSAVPTFGRGMGRNR